ncbi:phage portal protein [Novosphingobium sp. JCM 18896]|uniref:phage portal protein n=1 Tax=Novosphingobium sp. JCM 18896 TaxID=2989731 RepID=UPI002221C7B6|nr:phage portal protein [Novosphingobium sp. JCM 18896]MCW1429160.1 phage portal protein [Novosphingobium sp. JCM 18896]
MSFLQSLAAAFKGGGERVPLARSFVSPWYAAQALTYDYPSAVKQAYLDNPVAQRAVRLVAEGIGGAPLLPSEPAMARLVSATSAGQALLETLASHLLLHGNAYVQVMKDARGRPVELFALRPERMQVVAGPDGWPTAFAYRVGEKALTIPLEAEDAAPNLIHIRHFHPADDHYGAGCLSAAHQAVAIHNAAARWNRELLENAARPSGALVYENGEGAGLTSDQFDRLKAELTAAFSGPANAGRPMLLEGGLSWQALSLSPADMDFATLKAAAARDIALAFGVPPMLLGLPGDSTYANYREANRALWRLTLLPLAAKIFAALGEGLALWFPKAALAIDLDRVPALAEDRERLWAQVSAADFLSDAEKRAMLGLETPDGSSPARGGGAREARDGGVSPLVSTKPLHHSLRERSPSPCRGESSRNCR